MFNLKNLVSVAVLASGAFAAPQYTAHGPSSTLSAYTPVPTVPPVIGACMFSKTPIVIFNIKQTLTLCFSSGS